MKARKAAVKPSVKPSAARSQKRGAAPAPKAKADHPASGIGSIDELMAYAYALEVEASERYADFADAMEMHNNREVAIVPQTCASNWHAEQVLAKWATSRRRRTVGTNGRAEAPKPGVTGALPDGPTTRCRSRSTTAAALSSSAVLSAARNAKVRQAAMRWNGRKPSVRLIENGSSARLPKNCCRSDPPVLAD